LISLLWSASSLLVRIRSLMNLSFFSQYWWAGESELLEFLRSMFGIACLLAGFLHVSTASVDSFGTILDNDFCNLFLRPDSISQR